MLPKNHELTKIVKVINEQGYVPASLNTGYLLGLNAREQREYQRILDIHRDAKALYNGQHRAPTQEYSGERAAANAGAFTMPQAQYRPQSSVQPQVVNIYVYNNRQNSLWYDWWCWRMLTLDMMYPRSYPAPHRHPRRDDSSKRGDEPNAAQILLAIIGVLGAAVSTLYSFIEIGRCVDQLTYAEDILGNLSRITLGVLSAVAGGFAGFAFGASVLAMPLLGAVVGALIAAGVGVFLSKYLVEAIHQASPSQSALDYDPRFCLTLTEMRKLEAQGYDTLVVSEAIREVAIAYDKAHKSAWSLQFWGKDNRDKATLIDMLRLLKSGLVCEHFEFNEKTFSLKQNAYNPDIVMATALGFEQPVEGSVAPLRFA